MLMEFRQKRYNVLETLRVGKFIMKHSGAELSRTGQNF